MEIRNGRISRNKAIKILKNKGPEIPMSDIKLFCEYVDIEIKEFLKSLKNLEIKKFGKKIKGHGKLRFIIENWDWKKLQYEN